MSDIVKELPDLTGDMDARHWAAEFKRLFPDSDEDLMLAWFANAIMAGYDTAQNRAAQTLYGLPAKLDPTMPDGTFRIEAEARSDATAPPPEWSFDFDRAYENRMEGATAPRDAAPLDGWTRGDWMQTYTGSRFYPADPRPDEIDPLDIAHALSLLCRYGGHVDRFYSVAEHCVLMSYAVPEEDALAALLHDATEAYVVDVPRPLKRILPDYRVIEDRVWAAIAIRFHVDLELPASVKEADNRILLTERDTLMSNHERWEQDGVLEPLPVAVTGWAPGEAERHYLARLAALSAAPPDPAPTHPFTPDDDMNGPYCTVCGYLPTFAFHSRPPGAEQSR